MGRAEGDEAAAAVSVGESVVADAQTNQIVICCGKRALGLEP